MRKSTASNRQAAAEAADPDRGSLSTFQTEALANLDALYRTARRLSGSTADAEDLVQDTYVRAFRSEGRYEPGTNLRAWLFTILHNVAKNRWRDRARDAVTVDSDAVESSAEGPGLGMSLRDTPEARLVDQALGAELQAALDSLPESFRQAVWLRDVEEFSYAEIAAMLEIPIGTVMSRISRGRRLLFERLQRKPANA
jgi:RNA polymerase sigma-70 factor (ECF subfamily)